MAKAMQPQKMRFSQAIQTPMYKNLVNNTLGDPARGARFIANITSAVAVNPALQECNPGTILAGALLGESLLLQPSPQLGQFYLVPFKSKAKRDRQGNVIEPASVKAQFMLGYKGYIQLALRTGQYKRLNVLEVKAGELSGWDPFEERFHEMHFIEDFEKRAAMPTVGYIAHFEYINGFEKTLYWTADQMMAHADKYSQAFSAAAYKKLLNGEIPQGVVVARVLLPETAQCLAGRLPEAQAHPRITSARRLPVPQPDAAMELLAVIQQHRRPLAPVPAFHPDFG